MTIPKLTPYTGEVANPGGSQTQTEFTTNMFNQLSYEADLATELEATIDGMNDAVDEVSQNTAIAESSANAAEAAASSAGYQGLWPDTGGSALKGETYQTQVGGVPTGDYYTALQNTSVYPVGDNVNWKAVNDYGDLTDGLSVKQTRASSADIMGAILENGRIVKNNNDGSLHVGDGITLGGVKHVNVNTISNYTTLQFGSVADLTSVSMSKVKASTIDNGDILAKTQSYGDGWAGLAKPLGASEYILTTKSRVRDSLSNPTWEPDGYVNHGLFGGSDYVAMLHFGNKINAASCGASGYSNGDNTTAMRSLVSFLNELPSTQERIIIDLDGAVSKLTGSEVFKFSRELKKLSVINGSIIWKPVNADDRLFFIDENVKKIKCDTDIFTTIDTPDNIPRGDIFYFFSEIGDFTSSGNKFEDMFISGSEAGAYAPIRNIFNSQGYGQNDQTKVSNCRFETYYSVFRCFNPESVNWNFDRCGFFSIVLNHRTFWFDTLFGNFSVTNSSFSMAEQVGINYPTLLYTRQNNPTYPAPGDCNFLFENVRIESFANTGTENIRIVDANFGTIRFENIQTNLADANSRTWNIIGDAYVYIGQSTLGREVFTSAGLDGTVPIQKAFLEMDTVDVLNIPQLIVNGIPMAFEYFEANYEARLVIFRNVKDSITGRTINFTSYSDSYASGRFEEVISKPDSEHILQPFCTIDSIKFKYNSVDSLNYPKVRVRITKGAYSAEFDLSAISGDYELLPDNKYLMYIFNHNDGNLARIKFTLLDGTGAPQPSADFGAEITLGYTPISPRIAKVVGGVNLAKIVNIFGV